MKFFVLAAFIPFLMTGGCSNDKEKRPASDSLTVVKKDYFPVLDFLKGEIAYVDSFPLKIVQFRSAQGHKDSSIIQSAAFGELAKEFLSPALEKQAFEKDFTESSFLDQTSQSLTFTYSTKNDQIDVQRVDVLASPSLGFDKVKSIYIEKVIRSKDSSVVEKMYWKSRSNFQIIRILELPGHPASTTQLKVVWDNRE
jgi:hypothetical protein